MNITEIKTLLGKFYEGETTLEEEKYLQKYFAGNAENIENFAFEKYLFANLNFADDIEIPADLAENISAKIDNEAQKRIIKFRPAIKLQIISAVACIILLISITATIIKSNEKSKFIANININETEMMEILEHSFSRISNVVDDAFVFLDITGEQVCEINEVLNNL
jgi:hypothetical protein